MANSENTLIFTHEFDGAVKVSVEDQIVKIGDLTIEAHHSSDCCEYVYADFSPLELQESELNNFCIKRIEIKAVEEMGLIFFFYQDGGAPDRMGLLVNCYNEQNGYYSSNLSLLIKHNKSEQRIDVSNVVYDRIY
mgnify:CR=1 FL=1